MARIGRLAGALLVETEGAFFLVGNTKEPCDWREHGFEAPTEIDALKRPWISLSRVGNASTGAPSTGAPSIGAPSIGAPSTGAPSIGDPHLRVEMEGEGLLDEIARRMLVVRNGSVSERLWRLVLGGEEADDFPQGGVAARWLVEAPEPVWRAVRDAVLRCV
jgi:hypothetical protein